MSHLKSSIEVKLKGHKNQFYVLKVYDSEGNVKNVHTSKNIQYLSKLRKERYQSGT